MANDVSIKKTNIGSDSWNDNIQSSKNIENDSWNKTGPQGKTGSQANANAWSDSWLDSDLSA